MFWGDETKLTGKIFLSSCLLPPSSLSPCVLFPALSSERDRSHLGCVSVVGISVTQREGLVGLCFPPFLPPSQSSATEGEWLRVSF